MSSDTRVASRPYPFPLDGRLDATAVLVIDMQVDCCAAGDRERHETALRLLDKSTRTFGALADSKAFLEALG